MVASRSKAEVIRAPLARSVGVERADFALAAVVSKACFN